jgi:hypothetical protein
MIAIVLLVLFALLLVHIGVRWDRLNEGKPRTAREWYALHEQEKRDRADYFATHGPRPEWNGEKGGETK